MSSTAGLRMWGSRLFNLTKASIMAHTDKAECLNSVFHSVFTNQQACHAGMEVSSYYPDIGHLHIRRPGVAKQLSNLNSSKACGPDELPPKLLMLVADEIAPALAFLFQQSYNSGTVPTEWKYAFVFTSPVISVIRATIQTDFLDLYNAVS